MEPLPTLHGWLLAARIEVTPAEGIVEEIAARLDRGTVVAVTSSPRRGLEPTLETATELSAAGFPAVPHVAARLIRDGAHLVEMARRLEEGGIRDLLAVGGDSEHPAGPYASALDLLLGLEEAGHRFEQVGVAVYPERHPRIPDDALAGALNEKADHATYAVSNLCFDAGSLARWVRGMRESGFELPLLLGMSGPVQLLRLLRIAGRIGIGESTRLLRRDPRLSGGPASRGWYDPGPDAHQLARQLTGFPLSIRGVQISTFNDVAATERWRRRELGSST